MADRPKKICFVGAPSTGKTTLAKHFSEELARNNYSIELVGEFVRDYLVEHGSIRSPREQLAIAQGQKEKERVALERSPDYVVCDAASFLGQVYFNYLKDGIIDEQEARELEKIEKILWKEIEGEMNTYDFVFYLPQEFAPKDDGVRLYVQDVGKISRRIKDFLDSHNIRHHELRGSVEERAAKALDIIKKGTICERA